MENLNTNESIINQEQPGIDSEPPKIRKKPGPKPMIFKCELCGYEAHRIFDIQRHKAREKPCMNGEKMDAYILNKSKERLSNLLKEWEETPHIKRNKKRLTNIVMYIKRLVIVIKELEKIEDTDEYVKCITELENILSSIKS